MIDLVNNAVWLPHQINWRSGALLSRKWRTMAVDGLTGNQNRSSLTDRPDRDLSYDIMSFDFEDSRLIHKRVREMLKRGRAACPLWTEATEINPARTPESVTPFDPCQMREFAAGDWLALIRWPSSQRNTHRKINSGSLATVGTWRPDGFVTGGEVASTASTPSGTPLLYGPTLQAIPFLDYGVTPLDICQTWRKIQQPSAGPVPDPIRYSFTALDRSEHLIRLHFCDMTYDGVTEHAYMRLRVSGRETWEQDNFLTSNLRPKFFPIVIEVWAFPDAQGKITVEVHAKNSQLTGNFNAFITAVECSARSWEVFQADFGTTRENIVLPFRSLGDFPAGSKVVPILFGTPTVSRFDQVTDQHLNLRISVREPMGDGVLSVTSCPPEVCDLDIPTEVLTDDPIIGDGETCAVGQTGGTWAPLFGDDFTNNYESFNPSAIYKDLGWSNPGMAGLDPTTVDWWAGEILRVWQSHGKDYVEGLHNGVVTQARLYFGIQSPVVGTRWLASWYHEGGTIHGAFQYMIFMSYCITPNP